MNRSPARIRPWLSSKTDAHLREVSSKLEAVIDGARARGRQPASHVVDFHAAVNAELRSRSPQATNEEGPGAHSTKNARAEASTTPNP